MLWNNGMRVWNSALIPRGSNRGLWNSALIPYRSNHGLRNSALLLYCLGVEFQRKMPKYTGPATHPYWNPSGRITVETAHEAIPIPMDKCKIGVRRLTAVNLIAKCLYVETQLQQNSHVFPAPRPSLAELATARTTLVSALTIASDGGKRLTRLKNDAMVYLRDLLTMEAHYVDSVALGNVDILAKSGYETRRGNTTLGKLTAPTGMRTAFTGKSGEMRLRWNRRHGATAYYVVATRGDVNHPDAKWFHLGTTTRASLTAIKLQTGCFHAFAVMAIGAAGITARSQPAITIVG